LRLTINVKNLTLPPIVFRYFSSFNFENGGLNLGWLVVFFYIYLNLVAFSFWARLSTQEYSI
ncbi:hypothetical protein GLOIN_2v1732362, partial [Rhizophagus irregularis DAOM 181602=DAOM 197198]